MSDAVIEEWVEIHGCIWGYIYGDTKGRFKDGENIKTSSVVDQELTEIDEYMTIHTRNSTYTLGAKAGSCDED